MTRKSYISIFITLCIVHFCILSCTEKIELKTESFEDVLVVEATITDQLKYQEIKISRSYLLEDFTPIMENNATVIIEDSNQNVYTFHNAGNGLYVSDMAFQALESVSYILMIQTADGKQYRSQEEFLPTKVAIEKVYAELITSNGTMGLQVFADTNDNLGDATFFRYTYEETYKINTPHWVSKDVVFVNLENENSPPMISYGIEYVDRPIEQKTCYATNYSNEIILTNSNGLTENRISRFPIRFLSKDDSVLRDRYSILVNQYVQSANANNYYRILKEFSGDLSLLLDAQPGYVQGNIRSQEDNKEKVIGYFDVSSFNSKRIYFNYSDFDIRDKPPYFYECDNRIVSERYELYTYLALFNYKYVNHMLSEFEIVAPPCGDCTWFGSSIKPDFWEE